MLNKGKIITSCALALVVALSVALLAACSGGPDTAAESHEDQARTTAFNLGHLNSTAHVLAFAAKEEGYFEDEGLDVTLNQFSSGTELVGGLESEKLDAAFIGSVPSIVSQANGHDVSIFGGAMSNGHGYVIDSQYTDGLDDWDVTILKGKTVAVPRTTVQELELLQILDHYGITYAEDDGADVKLVYFDSQKDAYAALASPEIDAAPCYSPASSSSVWSSLWSAHCLAYSRNGHYAGSSDPCRLLNPAKGVCDKRHRAHRISLGRDVLAHPSRWFGRL